MDRSAVGSEPRPLTESVRAHKWSVLAIVGVVTASGLLLSYQQTPKYTSDSRVLVREEGSELDGVEPEVNLETERELADSPAVAELAMDELPPGRRPDSAEALLSEADVTPIEDTEILEFSYTHPEPRIAQERAAALSVAYLDFRRQQLQESVDNQIDGLEQEITILNDRLDVVDRRIDETNDDDRLARLQAQENTLLQLLLEKELARAELADIPSVGAIIKPAALPGSPSSPDHLVDAVLALIVGLAAGAGYAALRTRRAERIPSQGQIEGYIGAPVLGTVPRLERRRNRSQLLTDEKETPLLAESFRILRTNLLAVANREHARSILVTSARPGEGKSLTAANLAIVIARSGKRVTLVSADLRNAQLTRMFGRPVSPGLSDVLFGDVPLQAALIPIENDMTLLPGGPAPEDPGSWLASNSMADLLDELASQSRFVVIDAPPLLGMDDAVALGPLADGALVVVDGRREAHGPLRRAGRALDHAGVNVLGIVINQYRGQFEEGYTSDAYSRSEETRPVKDRQPQRQPVDTSRS